MRDTDLASSGTERTRSDQELVEHEALIIAMAATRVVIAWHAGALRPEEAMSKLYRTCFEDRPRHRSFIDWPI